MGRDRIARTNVRRPRIIVTDVDEDGELEAPSRQQQHQHIQTKAKEHSAPVRENWVE